MITREHIKDDAPSTAVYSDCERYRYMLTRTWAPAERRALFVMLNPSTATADIDDATVRRCVSFAARQGCGSLDIVNLHSFRSHDPLRLRDPHLETRGPDHWRHIVEALTGADLVVYAWGADAAASDRLVAEMHGLVTSLGLQPHHLGDLTISGAPRHPLYLPNSAELSRYVLR